MEIGQDRDLLDISQEIQDNWKNVYFGAVPYLEAMGDLHTMDDKYGQDSAETILLYFLSNATTWRGEVARRIKAELKAMLKNHKRR